ncbi:hypothetical protein ACVIKO_005465 [Rhizobium ruizarguesonis]
MSANFPWIDVGWNGHILGRTWQPIPLQSRPCLAKMLDTQSFDAMPVDATDPGQRCEVTIDHRDDPAISQQRRQQTLNTARVGLSSLAGTLGCLQPGLQPVCPYKGEQPKITPIFSQKTRCRNRFR